MPRLHVIDPVNEDSKGAKLLSGPYKDAASAMMLSLANHPKIFRSFLQFYGAVRGGALTDHEHELIALLCSMRAGCGYCVASHTPASVEAGMSMTQIESALQEKADDPKHQALIDFAGALIDTSGDVSDDQYQAFLDAGYDEQATIETIGSIGVMRFANMFNNMNVTETTN